MAGVRVIGLLYGRRFTSDNSRPISGPLTLENLAAEVYTISESWPSFQSGKLTNVKVIRVLQYPLQWGVRLKFCTGIIQFCN
jgi:hypothetical protein